MKNRVFIHIGLHKTATKYFQHHVFPFLDKEKFLYNSPLLDQYLMDYMMADKEDRKPILKYVLDEKQRLLDENPNKAIVISRESMAGNLFSAYKYWEESTQLLKDMFPEAKVLVSLRYQPDWLVSCYRESLHEHHYQNIDNFLNFDSTSKTFVNPEQSRNTEGYANLYALNLDFTRMLKRLYSLFNKEQVAVYFYEDLKNKRENELKKVLKEIGSEMVETKPVEGIPNRGYSALSIQLSIERANTLREKGLLNKLHRPIFFYGKNSIPAGNIERSVLDKDKYWGNQFLKDNEEVRSPNYPNLSEDEKLEYEKSWRYIVKNILDVKEYIDWDLLDDKRAILDKYYKKLNMELIDLLPDNVIPGKYYK